VKVFVAGATGVVGRPLVAQLVERGHEVTGMTRSERGAEQLRGQGARAAIADVFDEQAVRAAVAEAAPDALVHELADLPDSMNLRKLDEFYAGLTRMRSEGTRVLVGAVRAAGVGRLVAQSIAFLYAPEGAAIKDEDARVWHDAPGAFGKAIAATMDLERQVTEAGGVVLRYGWFYGPGTYYAQDGHTATEVRARRQPIVGRGDAISSFIHVEDAASATVAAVEGEAAGIFNVVDDDPAPARDWLPAFAEAVGAKPPRRVPAFLAKLVLPKDLGVVATELRGASNARFKREFGWEPHYASWREGFRDGIQAGPYP
jgi:2-alkyl-3-oxoalkanoate reductase